MTELMKHGLVLPGENISKYTSASIFQTSDILYGPGLKGNQVLRPGLLHSNVTQDGNFIFWIETHTKRYHDPVPGDVVLGTITQRLPEFFRVDIGTAEQGLLPMLSFQGATKRSKPDIYPGDLVVCEITKSTDSNSEPILTCVDERTGKANGLGVITGGGNIERPGVLSGMVAALTVVQSSGLAKTKKKGDKSVKEDYQKKGQTKKGSDCDGNARWLPLALCRRLLQHNSVILKSIGKHLSFEIAVGMNGLVWLNGGTIDKTMAIFTVIERCEFIPDEDVVNMINSIC